MLIAYLILGGINFKLLCNIFPPSIMLRFFGFIWWWWQWSWALWTHFDKINLQLCIYVVQNGFISMITHMHLHTFTPFARITTNREYSWNATSANLVFYKWCRGKFKANVLVYKYRNSFNNLILSQICSFIFTYTTSMASKSTVRRYNLDDSILNDVLTSSTPCRNAEGKYISRITVRHPLCQEHITANKFACTNDLFLIFIVSQHYHNCTKTYL